MINPKSIFKYSLLLLAFHIQGPPSVGHDYPHSEDTTSSTADIQTDIKGKPVHDSLMNIISDEYRRLLPIFKRSCFDCHSDQTKYPWYYKIPIVKQLIDGDIKEAHEHLVMTDTLPFSGDLPPVVDLNEIKEVIEEGEMPPFQYKIMHWDAGLSDSEVDSIVVWIDRSITFLRSGGPPAPGTVGHDNDD